MTVIFVVYINEYKKIGANGVVMAEPLAGMLSPALAEEFSETYVKQIVDAVDRNEQIRLIICIALGHTDFHALIGSLCFLLGSFVSHNKFLLIIERGRA